MNPFSIFMLGMAMSTDAFAAALAKGAAMGKPRLIQALKVGLIFGLVEAITPAIGWYVGSFASAAIESYDHWVAFILLSGLGLHAIYQATKPDEEQAQESSGGSLWSIALTGLATSIDAMAVGIGLAFVEINIFVVASVIGFCTFIMVTLGILIGNAVGSVMGRRAEMIGGAILILIGTIILYEHTR